MAHSKVSEPEDWIRKQVALCTLDLLGNLFLTTERDLQLKYAAMQQQIERVYQLHISAKYVALSGIKNLIYLVWMAAKVLSPPGQMPEEIERVVQLLTDQIM